MSSDYILEFRSIDPARRYYKSGSDKTHFLQGLRFLIKPYQRGFRWDAHDNVRKLLEDLFSYSEEHKHSALFKKTCVNSSESLTSDEFDFYCLQTLTLKCAGSEECKEWEVIDGQQRLTCMFLIYMVLSFFCGSLKKPYEILYQREEKEEPFSLSEKIDPYFQKLSTKELKEPEKADLFQKLTDHVNGNFDQEESEDIPPSYKIDSYYVRSAVIEIINFVSKKSKKQIETLLKCIKRNVYFLWYVVPEELSGEEVFLKINSGAIPLTNAELIKSLVLRNGDNDSSQNSRQWEAIELGLCDDELWSFIAGNFNSDTRIELLLDIYAREKSDEENKYSGNTANNPYALFDWYNEYSKSDQSFTRDVLTGMQDYYDRVAEWYDDVEIYHFVGLLTVYQKLGFQFDTTYKNQQEMLKLLLSEAENKTENKDTFIRGLKTKIMECLEPSSKNSSDFPSDLLEGLNYNNNDNRKIEAVLWLLNVWETVESSDNKTKYKEECFQYKDRICRRFPFSEALSGIWTLEHIFPQRPDDDSNKECLDRYNEIMTNKKCLKEEDVHSIKNLVLLKKDTNTLLQNEMLHIKRSRLISEIGKGSFIPCVTVNAFMLYYNIDHSKKDAETENLQIDDDWNYWTENDADNYEEAIIHCLQNMKGNQE